MSFHRLLGVAIAATMAAGIVGVFVKDTTPDMPTAQPPTPTPTLTFEDPEPTLSGTVPAERPRATSSPRPAPTRQTRPDPDPLPETGLPSQSILALFAVAGAAVLALERRRAR